MRLRPSFICQLNNSSHFSPSRSGSIVFDNCSFSSFITRPTALLLSWSGFSQSFIFQSNTVPSLPGSSWLYLERERRSDESGERRAEPSNSVFELHVSTENCSSHHSLPVHQTISSLRSHFSSLLFILVKQLILTFTAQST